METFICNQTKIPKDRWRYGLRSSAKVGCGWIAVYNALIQLGESPCPRPLLTHWSTSFPSFTAIWAPVCWGLPCF